MALTAGSGLAGSDLIYGKVGANSRKITLTVLAAFILASPTITGHPVIEGVTAAGATGTGNIVFASSPTLTTPNIGVPTASGLVTVTQAAANAGIIASTGYSLTGSNATNMIDLAGTWNTSGAPTALKIAITNTASGAAKFASFLAGAGGATEVFAIDKTGQISFPTTGTAAAPNITQATTGISWLGASYIAFVYNSSVIAGMDNGNKFQLYNNYPLSFDVGLGSGDLFLYRDAAGILAQRNSTNAQTLRVYNTYTDASNYERGVFDWTTTSNVLTIGTQAAGTGTARSIVLARGGTAILTLDAITSGAGNITIGGTSSDVKLGSYFGILTVTSTNNNQGARVGPTDFSIPSNGAFGFSSATNAIGGGSDTLIGRRAAATFQFGADDVASPVAQTLATQGSRAGTDTNVGGASLTIQPGIGTGTGTPSNLVLKGIVGTTTGTGAQAASAAITVLGVATGQLPSVAIGSAALATNATDGFLYIPTCAGTPTGTPTTATGRIPMVYDTSAHQFWFYDGGWKQPKTPAAAAIVTWQ